MSNYQFKSAQVGRSRLNYGCFLIKRTLLLPQKAVAFTKTNVFIYTRKQGSWTFHFYSDNFLNWFIFEYHLCSVTYVTYHLHFLCVLASYSYFVYFLLLFINIWFNSRERMRRPDATTLKKTHKIYTQQNKQRLYY